MREILLFLDILIMVLFIFIGLFEIFEYRRWVKEQLENSKHDAEGVFGPPL